MTDKLINSESLDIMKSMTEAAFLETLINVFLTDSPKLIAAESKMAAVEIETIQLLPVLMELKNEY